MRIGGELVETRELDEIHGTRQQLFETGAGLMEIDYSATVVGRAAPLPVEPTDEIIYLRPSRYVQSDIMQPFARETFAGLEGADLVRAVGAWVHERLSYVPTASTPTGGAVETLEAGAGVCRDYAHLTAALLRALDVPARLVSVYAPQLRPPDFHAVVEAVRRRALGGRGLHAPGPAPRDWCGWRPGGTRPTRRSSPTPWPTSCSAPWRSRRAPTPNSTTIRTSWSNWA